MKNLIAILILAFVSLGALAQNKMNVSVDETNGKIHLKLEKEVDGKKTVIDKTYNSIEEMKNDPELKDLDLKILNGEGHKFIFKAGEGEGDDDKEIDVNVVVEIDEDAEADLHKEMKHAIFLKSDVDGEKAEEIKIKIDENGKKHIYRNGKEIDPEEWEELEEGDFNFSAKDGKKVIVKKIGDDEEEIKMEVIVKVDGDDIDIDDLHENTFEFKSDDGEVIILKNGKKKVIKPGDDDVKVYTWKSEGDEKEKKKVKIMVTDKDKIHLLSEHGFEDVPFYDAEPLELNEIMYYPDLKSQKFKLQFKADSNPTELKLFSHNGDEIYAESIDKFKGKYSKSIDIPSLKKGVYLLQIVQGEKAFNKRVIID